MKKKKSEFNFQKFLHSKYGSFIAIVLSLSIIYGIGFIYTNRTEQIEAQETLSKIGSRGDEVRRIQNKLKSLGFFNGTVDGIYGAKTQSAVKRYQRSVGITADGVAGPKTLLYLGLGSSSGSSTTAITRPAEVVIEIPLGTKPIREEKAAPSMPDSCRNMVMEP